MPASATVFLSENSIFSRVLKLVVSMFNRFHERNSKLISQYLQLPVIVGHIKSEEVYDFSVGHNSCTIKSQSQTHTHKVYIPTKFIPLWQLNLVKIHELSGINYAIPLCTLCWHNVFISKKTHLQILNSIFCVKQSNQ